MFIIRADGNERTGAGHIMRCLTIGAQLIKKTPEKLMFLCADGDSAGLVRQQGFSARVLGTDYRDMESELAVWKQILDGGAEDLPGGSRRVILVDSYYVTDAYLEGLRQFGTVVLMDDMGMRKYPVDVVVNYNVTAEAENYQRLYSGTGTRLLLGSGYVPLREQFSNRVYQVREEVKNVLITAGGGDSRNLAGRILEILFDEDLEYHLVAGGFNPHYEMLSRMEREHENIHIHCNVADMAELMLAADIAVTAGGSTVYELACLGVPFLCFSCAENQEPLTEYIGGHQVAGFAGAFHRDPKTAAERLSFLFRKLVPDAELRRQYHYSERKITDGQGAGRIAEELQRLAAAGEKASDTGRRTGNTRSKER